MMQDNERLCLAPCAQSLAKLKRDVDGRGLPERVQYVWLLGCGANISDAQLDSFAKYGTGIGPDKVLLAHNAAQQPLTYVLEN